MSTPARITTSRPTTTQEKFQIPRFDLTDLSSIVMRVLTGQGGVGVICASLGLSL